MVINLFGQPSAGRSTAATDKGFYEGVNLAMIIGDNAFQVNIKKSGKRKGTIMKTRYIKNNMTKEWLLSNEFRYNRLFSDDEAEVYTYRFSVYKYNKFTVLECELKVVLGENIINVNVYDYNTNDKYAPFYYCEYGNYDKILKIINIKINNELKKLNIRNKKN